MTRKPLSPQAKAEAIARLQEVMLKFCEEQRQVEIPGGVLAALRDEPRDE